MSAQTPAQQPENAKKGRKAVDPNETNAQKLVRIANGRVTAVLDKLEKVAEMGPLVHKVAREADADPTSIVAQILGPIVEKYKAMQQSLETGKATLTGFSLKLD